MKAKKYLLLTNITIPVDSLKNLSNKPSVQLDYLIHSTENETEHTGDLRNLPLIQKHIEEGITIIFYLTGNLKVFVINELLKKKSVKNYSVLFIYSALLDYLPSNNLEFQANETAINLLKLKNINSIFISVLFTDEKNSPSTELIACDPNVLHNFRERKSKSLDILLRYILNNYLRLKNQNNKFYFFTLKPVIYNSKQNYYSTPFISKFLFNLLSQFNNYFSSLNYLEYLTAFNKAVKDYSSQLINKQIKPTDNHLFFINKLKEI